MTQDIEALVQVLRAQVQDALAKHRYQHAITLADKLVSFSGGAAEDVHRLADTYFRTGQYKRCLHTLKYHRLVRHRYPTSHRPRPSSLTGRGDIRHVYLAARSSPRNPFEPFHIPQPSAPLSNLSELLRGTH